MELMFVSRPLSAKHQTVHRPAECRLIIAKKNAEDGFSVFPKSHTMHIEKCAQSRKAPDKQTHEQICTCAGERGLRCTNTIHDDTF